MFGRTGRRLDWCEKELMDVGRHLYDKVDSALWLRTLKAHTTALNDLSARVDVLASALGYEWVPEGKTAARWEKKAPRRGK